jgi:hypothetical protein
MFSYDMGRNLNQILFKERTFGNPNLYLQAKTLFKFVSDILSNTLRAMKRRTAVFYQEGTDFHYFFIQAFHQQKHRLKDQVAHFRILFIKKKLPKKRRRETWLI